VFTPYLKVQHPPRRGPIQSHGIFTIVHSKYWATCRCAFKVSALDAINQHQLGYHLLPALLHLLPCSSSPPNPTLAPPKITASCSTLLPIRLSPSWLQKNTIVPRSNFLLVCGVTPRELRLYCLLHPIFSLQSLGCHLRFNWAYTVLLPDS
jgi:hypothetical protein